MIFVDLDGTLNQFHKSAGCLESAKFPSFFEGLEPYQNIVDAINDLITVGINVAVLTSCSNEDIASAKVKWLSRYIPKLSQINFIWLKNGCNKAVEAQNWLGRPLHQLDILVDDYSANLLDWLEAGGTPVKFLNGINCRGFNGSNFTGDFIDGEWASYEIAQKLINLY